jgi:type IV pilus assembly protein PilE
MKKHSGFTLIELMIVVVVLGILASITYPNYMESVRKSRRADAKGALMGFANAMERHFTETNSYCNAAATTVGSCTDATGVPKTSIYSSQSPVDGGTAFYNLRVGSATATTFTLTAAPTGPQTGDKCGTLTLAHTGAKGITGQATGITVADCW